MISSYILDRSRC